MTELLTAGFAPDLVPYDVGWALQRRVHRNVVSGSSPDTLILLEHEPVFTAGTRTLPDERPANGAPVVDVDRGGKITWHGHGQLTGYPIVRLAEPVVDYVRRLESTLIGVLADIGITGERVRGRSGVWVDSPGGYNKIGAIGVRVSDNVTMHGFALNCSNSLEPFTQIVPCGIRDAGVTTVSLTLGRTVTPADLADAVAAAFGAAPARVPV
ncbi:lipoyl(octanoyl) transferase LipB [Okibacterium endophyticum]